jgi:hypothetical protein
MQSYKRWNQCWQQIHLPPPCQTWQVERQQKSSRRKRESPWWT